MQHFFFSGAFLLYINFSCRERHGIFKNLDQEHCFGFHSYLHDSYMYIHAAHASMDCQILPYMHRPRDPLNLAYLHPQVHGSSYLCIPTTMNPHTYNQFRYVFLNYTIEILADMSKASESSHSLATFPLSPIHKIKETIRSVMNI